MEENTRLTDLTRMLLSSQAFSGFLSELSGTASSSTTRTCPPPQSRPQSQPSQKDINPHQLARHLQDQHPQIGMATIPEIPLDFPLAENTTSASSWNATSSLNNFPVYSLVKLPECPALDIEKLSGKQDQKHPSQTCKTVKKDIPVIEHGPTHLRSEDSTPSSYTTHSHLDSELNGTAFALYAEPSFPYSRIGTPLALPARLTANAEKADPHFDLFLEMDQDVTVAGSKLALMCSELDAVSARIRAVTSHLD